MLLLLLAQLLLLLQKLLLLLKELLLLLLLEKLFEQLLLLLEQLLLLLLELLLLLLLKGLLQKLLMLLLLLLLLKLFEQLLLLLEQLLLLLLELLLLLLERLLLLLLLLLLLDGFPFLDFSVDLDGGLVVTRVSGLLADLNLVLVSINNHGDLLLLGSFLGGNSNSGPGGGFSEDDVVTVVHGVVIFIPVKGGNLARFQGTGAGRVEVGQLLHDLGSQGVSGADGQESLSGRGKTNISGLYFFTVSSNLDIEGVSSSINLSLNVVF